MSSEKSYGTKWLDFLYGFIVFQCVMLVISLLLVIGEAQRYATFYGSSETMEGIVCLSVLAIATSFIVKIFALKKKYTESGYTLLIASLVIDVFCVLVLGVVKAGISGLMTILLIPNLIYLKKRKALFDRNQAAPQITDPRGNDAVPKRNYKCSKCGKVGPYIGDCPACGSSLKCWFDVEAPANARPAVISKGEESNEPKKSGDAVEADAERSVLDPLIDTKTVRPVPIHKWMCSSCGKMITENPCPYCGK